MTSRILWAAAFSILMSYGAAQAQTGTEFPGTVLMVDQTAGKFAVKKESGGTRFTFVTNDKTQFLGAGLAGLKDLKKDERIIVVYQVQGSQYVALRVMRPQ